MHEDTLESLQRTRFGEEQGFDLAFITDGLREEREQGITIDVAYRYFRTPRRSFIIADCPGMSNSLVNRYRRVHRLARPACSLTHAKGCSTRHGGTPRCSA